MIIGIVGNSKTGKVKLSEYFKNNYSFKYFDVDELVSSILKENYYAEKLKAIDWKNDIEFLLRLRNDIDERIRLILSNLNDNDIIVIDYSLLEDSYIFDKADVIMKVSDTAPQIVESEVGLMLKHRLNSLQGKYNNSKYHFEVYFDENWEVRLSDYIDYNIMGDTKVTVVVPVYNTFEYLSKCVNSITNQTYRNLEIILVNDGSTDDSLRLCELLAKNDSRIKVVTQKNKGLADTRNFGMELATGEYICFIDSDDYIDNKMIETLLKTAMKTNADVCEGSFFIHMKNGFIKDVTCEQKGIQFVEDNLDLVNAYSDATILIPAWDKIYKLSSIKDTKFDKTCFKEDADYIFRLCMEGKKFALVPIPFYHYVKRKSVSITGNKISSKLFTLKDWGYDAYNKVLSRGEKYRDAAEKILYNSLVHILRNYMRDYKNNVLEENEYQAEIQDVVNDIINLLLRAKNVEKFRKLEEVLSIINELTQNNVLNKEKMPSIEIPCVGILWNSLNKEMMEEAIAMIKEKSTITGCVAVDLEQQYRQFINEIYLYNNEFEGIPVIKAGTLIDKYDSNTIVVLNLIMKVSNYMYFNAMKGFIFEEIAELKSLIRKFFKTKITDYAYDNIFHLTVDNEEYEYTNQVCKKFIREYRGNGYEKK